MTKRPGSEPNALTAPRAAPKQRGESTPEQKAVQVPSIRVMMMPRDTNALGTIFGGIILSHIDQAGAVEAHKTIPGRLVTVAITGVEFHQPVFVGDLVSYFTATTRVGRTSVTVKVTVQAERRTRGREKVIVTEAELVYVRVDEDIRPVPI